MSDTVTALISTGTNVTTTIVNPANEASGTLVPISTTGIGTNSLVLYNWNPATQLTHFLAAEAQVAAGVTGARAKIVTVGDSTTAGVGGASIDFRNSVSYVEELTLALKNDGIATQSDNFLGGYTTFDGRIALIHTAEWSGLSAAGGNVIDTRAAGDGFTFTLNAPANYDRVDINYVDLSNATISVSVDGGPASTFQTGNTGNMMTKTINIPAGTHSQVTVTAATANTAFIEGAAFWDSTSPSVEVYNAGIPGTASNIVGASPTTGYGDIQGVAALQPNLVLIDYGINDINTGLTNGTETISQIAANIGTMVTTLRAAGSDVIIVIPEPFASATSYVTALPALRTALYALATADNVPIIDLSATYNDNYAALVNAGLMFDNLHPDATLYADIGSKIAGLLTQTITQAAACFATGTKILTPHGETAVEDLAIGDSVITLSNGPQPIIWTGQRRLELHRHPRPVKVQPICIFAHAIAPNMPARNLIVSPDHALYLSGHLVPAKALVNGFTIRQLTQRNVTYYHIELGRHAVVFAEGMPAETYLESGNRSAFENAGAALFLQPDFEQARRETKSCAPFAEAGPVVEAIRARILRHARIQTTSDPEVEIIYQRGDAVIRSRSTIPGEIYNDPRDRRRLGVKIAAIQVAGKAIPLGHPALAEGWHGIEPDGRWTNGNAVIPGILLNGSKDIRISLAAALDYPCQAALQKTG